MNVLKIDRTAAEHKDYTGAVELTYDEIVIIQNALGQKARREQSEFVGVDVLYRKWSSFAHMACYGGIAELLPVNKKADDDDERNALSGMERSAGDVF